MIFYFFFYLDEPDYDCCGFHYDKHAAKNHCDNYYEIFDDLLDSGIHSYRVILDYYVRTYRRSTTRKMQIIIIIIKSTDIFDIRQKKKKKKSMITRIAARVKIKKKIRVYVYKPRVGDY